MYRYTPVATPLGRIALLRDIPHRSPFDCFSALVVIVVNADVVMFERDQWEPWER